MPAGIIAIICLTIFCLLVPLLFIEVMVFGFYKLGISPILGVFIVMAIILGSFVNIPIKRYQVEQENIINLRGLYGIDYYYPGAMGRMTEQIMAINLGGAVIPLTIVIFQLLRLFLANVFVAPLLAILINTLACYVFSQNRPGVGVLLPAFLPGVLAALSGLVLHPDNPSSVAFCAGVLGPLIGADLLRINQVRKSGAVIFSIGGAGTFDGIVISGMVALLLS